MPRAPFHLSLRTDDPFEASLLEALRRMPYGYSKQFWIRLARIVLLEETDPEKMGRLMYDIAHPTLPISMKIAPKFGRSRSKYPKCISRKSPEPVKRRKRAVQALPPPEIAPRHLALAEPRPKPQQLTLMAGGGAYRNMRGLLVDEGVAQ